MNHQSIRLVNTFLCMVLLTACTVRPFNTSPLPLISANSYHAGFSEAEKSSPWYESFGAEGLNMLIEQALSQNMNIGQAVARLEQARAESRKSRTGLVPAVDSQISSEKNWEGGASQEGGAEIELVLSWEVDAFGRIRNALESDYYLARAAAQDVETVRLILSADIASNYFQAAAQSHILKLLKEQEQLDLQFYNLVSMRFKQGVGTRLEQLQQESQLAETLSLVPNFESQKRLFENRLDVLLGYMPDGLDRVTAKTEFFLPSNLPPVGVPSDLLLNRPDLKALKNELIAADADISSAFADRLPRISLDGSFLLSDGGAVSNPVFELVGGLMQPLLDWGSRKAEQTRNEALYKEKLYAFSQAYLEAVADVETILYQENKQREFISKLEKRREVLGQTVENSKSIYTQGLSDYLPVLSALQDLRVLERDIINEKLELTLLRIRLHRALGGALPDVQYKSYNAKK